MNSDPVQKFFLGVSEEDNTTNSNFSKLLELSETIGARKLILWLQVNTDKANSCIDDVPRRWYIGGPAKIHKPHTSVYCIYSAKSSSSSMGYLSGSLAIYG